MMWLGGIPVQREQSNNLVAASIDAIKAFYAPFKGKNADQFDAA